MGAACNLQERSWFLPSHWFKRKKPRVWYPGPTSNSTFIASVTGGFHFPGHPPESPLKTEVEVYITEGFGGVNGRLTCSHEAMDTRPRRGFSECIHHQSGEWWNKSFGETGEHC